MNDDVIGIGENAGEFVRQGQKARQCRFDNMHHRLQPLGHSGRFGLEQIIAVFIFDDRFVTAELVIPNRRRRLLRDFEIKDVNRVRSGLGQNIERFERDRRFRFEENFFGLRINDFLREDIFRLADEVAGFSQRHSLELVEHICRISIGPLRDFDETIAQESAVFDFRPGVVPQISIIR